MGLVTGYDPEIFSLTDHAGRKRLFSSPRLASHFHGISPGDPEEVIYIHPRLALGSAGLGRKSPKAALGSLDAAEGSETWQIKISY